MLADKNLWEPKGDFTNRNVNLLVFSPPDVELTLRGISPAHLKYYEDPDTQSLSAAQILALVPAHVDRVNIVSPVYYVNPPMLAYQTAMRGLESRSRGQ